MNLSYEKLKNLYDQVRWERDLAIEQLHELGGELGEKTELIKERIQAESAEEIKFLRQWKDDVMEEFDKFDASSVDEIAHHSYNKAIHDYEKALLENNVNTSVVRRLAGWLRREL